MSGSVDEGGDGDGQHRATEPHRRVRAPHESGFQGACVIIRGGGDAPRHMVAAGSHRGWLGEIDSVAGGALTPARRRQPRVSGRPRGAAGWRSQSSPASDRIPGGTVGRRPPAGGGLSVCGGCGRGGTLWGARRALRPGANDRQTRQTHSCGAGVRRFWGALGAEGSPCHGLPTPPRLGPAASQTQGLRAWPGTTPAIVPGRRPSQQGMSQLHDKGCGGWGHGHTGGSVKARHGTDATPGVLGRIGHGDRKAPPGGGCRRHG